MNWCINHPEAAIDRLGEKQKELSEWERELNRGREDEKKIDDLYWEIRGLIEDFGRSYGEVIATKNNLKSLREGHSKGEVLEDNFLQKKSQLKNKLTDSFQSLIDIHEKIENKIPPSLFFPNKEEKEERIIHIYDRSERDWKSEFESLKEKYDVELTRREILLASCNKEHEELKAKLDAAMMELDLSCLDILARYKVLWLE